MFLTSSLRNVGLSALVVATLSAPLAAANSSTDIPKWLNKHVGTDDGKIAPVVLQRARALYQEKRRTGGIKNDCYFAMDATRPSTASNGSALPRFYVICEKAKTFKAVSSGYGNGRKLAKANFSNGRQCARNFSNAEGSKLTSGGAYVTAESRTSFKGYYQSGSGKKPFLRTFLLFDGEGETSNARERAIGGHRAMFLRWQCRMEKPQSTHADADGFVPFGKLVEYTSGRSNGCTTWSKPATQDILKIADGNPTTLYIYPSSKDINAVAKAIQRGKSPQQAGHYWNAGCLKTIGVPKFWPKKTLQPIINEWRDSLPKQPPLELPLCK
ncbi:murein L,D-transpeptidase catalytic domain family protein [uncultured Shimia sp.]|uniref:murein L,D-transpeptidase catalytic domain family protein n=1 Tax=uncultured Shimia sp. TaxID=573152 RepID=UPI0025FB0040|nr:murein L,D-transpeptidase catalytic domain family protein [uncultured Shimia sp.]